MNLLTANTGAAACSILNCGSCQKYLNETCPGSRDNVQTDDQYNNAENNFDLTRREMEVLFFVAEGLSNVEISEILNISPHTVKGHVINIFNKFGVNNRTQASVQAVRYNII